MKHRNAPEPLVNAKLPELRLSENMLIEERRQHILALAHQNGRVIVEDLSNTLGISRITIRKDLNYLQRKGVLQRTHGGAIPPQSGSPFDPLLKEKETQHSEEKQRISDAGYNLFKRDNAYCSTLEQPPPQLQRP